MNFKLTIEYDGQFFSGWQKQLGQITVQGELERFIKIVLQSEAKKNNNFYLNLSPSFTLTASGRTDAGVHAIGQVANLRFRENFPIEIPKLKFALNGLLKGRASVIEIKAVPDEFDARRSAHSKIYTYLILNRSAPPIINKNYVWHIRKLPYFELMNETIGYFEGEHDFKSFRASDCNAKTTIRTIYWNKFDRLENDLIKYSVCGSGFLKHQVRFIVGALVAIGQGKLEPSLVLQMLSGYPRSPYKLAPAKGLMLDKVIYL